MKRTIYILLIVICLFAFASCENKVPTVGKYNVPLWLAGKTWSGTVTVTSSMNSGTPTEVEVTYAFDEAGNPDFLEKTPEGSIIAGSNNGDTYIITVVGSEMVDGISITAKTVEIFIKVSDTECKFKGTATVSGVDLTIEQEGTLRVKE